MTGPNLVSRVVIRAADVAAAPKTTEMVSKTANAIVDNQLGRWGAHKVDDIGGKILEAPATQHAAQKAEGLVTNVINSVPIVKDLASSLFEKVNAFISTAKLKSPMIKAYKLGMELLSMAQQGKTDEQIAKHTKSAVHILKDDLHTPASKIPAVQEIEAQVAQLGINLRATDNQPFANVARRAATRMKAKGIEVPEIRLSSLFPADDKGYTNPEIMPPSTSAVFLNAKADWAKEDKMMQIGKQFQTYATSAPEHPIYHLVGRTMYNGKAGDEPLMKMMPERERLVAQGIATSIETPEDFMGEIFAHLMDGNEVKKELTPIYKIYEDWGGKVPANINIAEGRNTVPTVKAAEPLQDLDLRI